MNESAFIPVRYAAHFPTNEFLVLAYLYLSQEKYLHVSFWTFSLWWLYKGIPCHFNFNFKTITYYTISSTLLRLFVALFNINSYLCKLACNVMIVYDIGLHCRTRFRYEFQRWNYTFKYNTVKHTLYFNLDQILVLC